MAANGQRIHPAGSRRNSTGSHPHAAVPADQALQLGSVGRGVGRGARRLAEEPHGDRPADAGPLPGPLQELAGQVGHGALPVRPGDRDDLLGRARAPVHESGGLARDPARVPVDPARRATRSSRFLPG